MIYCIPNHLSGWSSLEVVIYCHLCAGLRHFQAYVILTRMPIARQFGGRGRNGYVAESGQQALILANPTFSGF